MDKEKWQETYNQLANEYNKFLISQNVSKGKVSKTAQEKGNEAKNNIIRIIKGNQELYNLLTGGNSNIVQRAYNFDDFRQLYFTSYMNDLFKKLEVQINSFNSFEPL